MLEKIEITNPDDSSNQISLFQEAENSKSPVVVIFPAMGVWAKFYTPLAEALTKHHLNAALVDLRGNDKSSIRPGRGSDFGYHDMMAMDYETTIQVLRKRFPDSKIILLGHSLGGQLAALYLSKNPQMADGLILIACCSVYYKGWNGIRRFGALFSIQLFALLARIFGYFPGTKVGFGGVEAKTVMIDWSHLGRTGNYALRNTNFDYEGSLKDMDKPTLVISFAGDMLAPKKAVENLIQKLESTRTITHIHLAKDDPRNDQFSHLNWVKKPNFIVKIILREMKSLA